MRILNFGSLNVDKTYKVKQFARAKETIKAWKYEEFCGGKGLNQSIALAKAGAAVVHAGCVGQDGKKLIETLAEAGVDTNYIRMNDGSSGHAIIQVDESGQNSIIIYGGANEDITKEYIDEVLNDFGADDMVLLQNEIINVDYVIKRARQKGLKITFNPSPVSDSLKECELESIDYFILNEVEGEWISKVSSSQPEKMIETLEEKYPQAAFVLTLGEGGSYFFSKEKKVYQKIYKVPVIDTTGAGDTFTGYFLSEIVKSGSVENALKYAAAAASISVSRHGAAQSIPDKAEVEKFVGEH